MAESSIEKIKNWKEQKVEAVLSLYEADLIRILRTISFGEFVVQIDNQTQATIKKAYGQPYQIIIQRSELLTPQGGLELEEAIIVTSPQK